METDQVTPNKKTRRRKSAEEKPVEETKHAFLPEITLDISKLPSRGVPYPKDAKLKYRTYSFGEVQKSSISNMTALETVKTALSGIETSGFDKHLLTLFDILYIGVLRKVSSMSDLKFEMPYVCRTCNKTTKSIFTHNDIEFKDMESIVTELPLIVEINNREVHFSPMTVKDFMALHGGRYSKYLKDGHVDKLAVHTLMIRNMEFADAYKFLEGINDPEDIEMLQEVDKILLHDLKPLKAKCTEKDDSGEVCGSENSLKLEGREALLQPFRGRAESRRAKIRFGNK